jgi:2,3-bisphosphoglycerate-independent phosphoglycerate mutase
MKYIVLVGDGMADRPIEELGGRTPLEVAKTPNMDEIATRGRIGLAKTVPEGMEPASDVANLSILGYDPARYYTGRGPLEAANLGVELKTQELAFRCNLITVDNETLIDYSANHIATEEAAALINYLNKKMHSKSVSFHPGVSYRHIVVIKDKERFEGLRALRCTPPHNITKQRFSEYLPAGEHQDFIRQIMFESRKLLKDHEVNQVRIDLGENPANMIWLWGQGSKPDLPSFKEKYKVTGSVISAVDLIQRAREDHMTQTA